MHVLIKVPSRSIRTQDESFFNELLIDIIIKFTIRTIFVLSCDGSSTPVNELRGRRTTKQRAEMMKKKG